MKIVFINYTQTKMWPGMEEITGMGASDFAMFQWPAAMADMGHEVHLYCNTKKEERYKGVTWHSTPPTDKEPCDILFINRSMRHHERFAAGKKVLIMHDDMDAPVNAMIHEALHMIDEVVVLSQYQKEQFNKMVKGKGKEFTKVHVVGEGVMPTTDLNGKPKSPSICYCSAPYKGLHILAKAWPLIKEHVPDCKLHVCTGMGLYGREDQDVHFKPIYHALRQDPNVVMHGVLTNKETRQVMHDCDVMAFPNDFKETFCAAAYESISVGTPVITSHRGALPEVVGDCGILVKGEPRSKEYLMSFADKVIGALKYKTLLETMRAKCASRHTYTWYERAQQLLDAVTKEAKN